MGEEEEGRGRCGECLEGTKECFCETCCCSLAPTIRDVVHSINKTIANQLNDDGYIHDKRRKLHPVVDRTFMDPE